MPSWPSDIPQAPTRQGFQRTRMDGRLRSSMDAGPDKVRRRFTAVPEHLTCVFLFSPAELATFWTFFDTTLVGGSLSFDWTHPITGVSVTARIQDVPSDTPQGLYWGVSMTIEVLP